MNIHQIPPVTADLVKWLTSEESIQQVQSVLESARELNNEVIRKSEVEPKHLVEPVSY